MMTPTPSSVIQAKLVGAAGGPGRREDEHRRPVRQGALLRVPGVHHRRGLLLAGAARQRRRRGRHRQVRHLGHRRPGALPQPRPHVLPRGRRRRRRLRHHQHGFVHPGKEVGGRASETREPTSGDGVSGQQGRSGKKEEGWHTGGAGVRGAERPLLPGDVGQDGAERRRALLRASRETGEGAAEPSGRDGPARRPARRRGAVVLLLRVIDDAAACRAPAAVGEGVV
ncbi:hypothetical protein VPH35_125221 [Triticum aestivum]|uniref:Uncharacterized protein n=1 Tax=Triticum urartu TaxID=4572 RepID=A0A8R7R937_TRIUA